MDPELLKARVTYLLARINLAVVESGGCYGELSDVASQTVNSLLEMAVRNDMSVNFSAGKAGFRRDGETALPEW